MGVDPVAFGIAFDDDRARGLVIGQRLDDLFGVGRALGVRGDHQVEHRRDRQRAASGPGGLQVRQRPAQLADVGDVAVPGDLGRGPAHNRRHSRPSRRIRASASAGPQVPAA